MDPLKGQTATATPAEPGGLFGFASKPNLVDFVHINDLVSTMERTGETGLAHRSADAMRQEIMPTCNQGWPTWALAHIYLPSAPARFDNKLAIFRTGIGEIGLDVYATAVIAS
jgi:hypothetical protein